MFLFSLQATVCLSAQKLAPRIVHYVSHYLSATCTCSSNSSSLSLVPRVVLPFYLALDGFRGFSPAAKSLAFISCVGRRAL